MLTRAVKFPERFVANAASRNVEGHHATFVHLVLALVQYSQQVWGIPWYYPGWINLTMIVIIEATAHEGIQIVHKNCRRKTDVEIYIKVTKIWFNMLHKHTTILHVHTSAWDRCSLATDCVLPQLDHWQQVLLTIPPPKGFHNVQYNH